MSPFLHVSSALSPSHRINLCHGGENGSIPRKPCRSGACSTHGRRAASDFPPEIAPKHRPACRKPRISMQATGCHAATRPLYGASRGWRGRAPRQPGQIRKEAAVTSPAWVVVQSLTFALCTAKRRVPLTASARRTYRIDQSARCHSRAGTSRTAVPMCHG